MVGAHFVDVFNIAEHMFYPGTLSGAFTHVASYYQHYFILRWQLLFQMQAFPNFEFWGLPSIFKVLL